MTHTDTLPRWSGWYTRAALTALPADITTATPPQVDEVIRTVQLEAQGYAGQLDRAYGALLRGLGFSLRSERVGNARSAERREWWVNRDEVEIDVKAEVKASRALPADTPAAYGAGRDIETIGQAWAVIDGLRADLADMARVEQAGHDEYDRRGTWTRYYLVANTGGHVHTTMGCDTCYPTTRFDWPTALSGSDAHGVVEAAGSLTCLRCFPEVRDEILLNRDPDRTRFETPERRDEREAAEKEKADKLAAKIAKGVTPDGSALQVRIVRSYSDWDDPCEIKTENAAQLRLVDALYEQSRGITGTDARGDRAERAELAITTLVDALAWKRGITAQQVRDQVAPKVAKRVNRGY